MNALLRQLSSTRLPQALRFPLLLLVYSGVLTASLCISYQLRFEFNPPSDAYRQYAGVCLWLLPLSLASLWLVGQFRSLLSYFSVPDMTRIALSQGAVFAIAVAVWYLSNGLQAPPRSVLIMNLVGSTAGLSAFRLGLRLLRERYSLARPIGGAQGIRRVAVIGATDAGAELIKEMKHRPDLHMQPVAIFDEDRKHLGRQIHGVPILGSYELLLSPQNSLEIAEVIVAHADMDSASYRRMMYRLAATGLKCKVAPSGLLHPTRNHRHQLRPIEVEDLLGREPVDLRTDQIQALVKGRRVAVSGAGGSIGSELCRQILDYEPSQLVLIEQCEVQLFAIEQELTRSGSDAALVPCVADILDEARLGSIFGRHRPDIVFHAAAHKHVPLMEHQPQEAFQNNVIGTLRLAEAALAHGCERFVLISSDKAINPTSVMGATKRLAEIYLQALHASRAGTKFMAVRFGNVLGSSGSVIPTFKRQIAEGGPVTVTHPDVTRYFMSVSEAVGLVLQSATLGQGGEVFVLDMGTPVRIMDLARQTIELSGLRPGVDIEIRITGLRPGEKLFEELNHSSENHAPTAHPKITRLLGRPPHPDQFLPQLRSLYGRVHALAEPETKREIQKLVPEYRPYLPESAEAEPQRPIPHSAAAS